MERMSRIRKRHIPREQILALSNNPLERPGPNQRTSGCPRSEELFERPLRVAGLKVKTRAPALTKASASAWKPAASEAAKPAAATSGEAPWVTTAARAVFESFLAVAVVDAPLVRVGEDFVGLGHVMELLCGPLGLVLVLVGVVLQR